MKLTNASKLLYFIFLCASTDACADWQWTKWGMTEQQLIESAKNNNIIIDVGNDDMKNKNFKHNITQKYETASGSYLVRFYFSRAENGLTQVALDPELGCEGTKKTLELTYGDPTAVLSRRPIIDTTWRDAKNKNGLMLREIIGNGIHDCILYYSQLDEKEGSGL